MVQPLCRLLNRDRSYSYRLMMYWYKESDNFRAYYSFGSCTPYIQWSRPLPCDELYTPDVDYFFLPNSRTPGNVANLYEFAANMKATLDTISEPCRCIYNDNVSMYVYLLMTILASLVDIDPQATPNFSTFGGQG